MGMAWLGFVAGCSSPPPPRPVVSPAAVAPAEPLWAPVPEEEPGWAEPTPPVVPVSLRTARRVLRERAPRVDPLAQEAVAQLLYRAEAEHGIPVLTVLGMIQQESRFDPRARGPRGSLGLMQIRPFVARDVATRHSLGWRGDSTLYDPVANVRIGIAYLLEQKERFGSTELALAAYNVGPSRLKRLLAAGRSGRGAYVRRVLEQADALAAQYAEPDPAVGG